MDRPGADRANEFSFQQLSDQDTTANTRHGQSFAPKGSFEQYNGLSSLLNSASPEPRTGHPVDIPSSPTSLLKRRRSVSQIRSSTQAPTQPSVHAASESAFHRSRNGSTQLHQYLLFPTNPRPTRSISNGNRFQSSVSSYSGQRCELPASLTAKSTEKDYQGLGDHDIPDNKQRYAPTRGFVGRGILKTIQNFADQIRPEKKHKSSSTKDDSSPESSPVSLSEMLRENASPRLSLQDTGHASNFGEECTRLLSSSSTHKKLARTQTRSHDSSTASSACSITHQAYSDHQATPPASIPNLDSFNFSDQYVVEDRIVSLTKQKLTLQTMLDACESEGLLNTVVDISPKAVLRPYRSLELATIDMVVNQNNHQTTSNLSRLHNDMEDSMNYKKPAQASLGPSLNFGIPTGLGIAIDSSVNSDLHAADSVEDIMVEHEYIISGSAAEACTPPAVDKLMSRRLKVDELKRKDLATTRPHSVRHVSMYVNSSSSSPKTLLRKGSAPSLRNPSLFDDAPPRAALFPRYASHYRNKPLPAPPSDSNGSFGNDKNTTTSSRCTCQCCPHSNRSITLSRSKRQHRQRRLSRSNVVVLAETFPDHTRKGSTARHAVRQRQRQKFEHSRSVVPIHFQTTLPVRLSYQQRGDSKSDIVMSCGGVLTPMVSLDDSRRSKNHVKPESQVLSAFELLQLQLSPVVSAEQARMSSNAVAGKELRNDCDRQVQELQGCRATRQCLKTSDFDQLLAVSENHSPHSASKALLSPDLTATDSDVSTDLGTSFGSSVANEIRRKDSFSSATDHEDVSIETIKVVQKKRISPNTSRKYHKLNTSDIPSRIARAPTPTNTALLPRTPMTPDRTTLDTKSILNITPSLSEQGYMRSPSSLLASMDDYIDDIDNCISPEVEVNHCLVSSSQMDTAIDNFVIDAAAIEHKTSSKILQLPFSVKFSGQCPAPGEAALNADDLNTILMDLHRRM